MDDLNKINPDKVRLLLAEANALLAIFTSIGKSLKL
jgi:hypothetical protein